MQIHLNTYGTYLHVKDQMFEIKIKEQDGQTSKHHVAAHKVKSIWAGEGIAFSSEAVRLAIMNNIDIVFLHWDGKPIGRVWHTKLGSTTLIRKKQLEASLGHLAVDFTKEWLVSKLGNQAKFIKSLKKHRLKHRVYLDEKSARIEELCHSIKEVEAPLIEHVADQIRGWEGTAGRLYFETISHVIPKQYKFRGRSFRPSQDAFNAFLNYGYGVLYSRIEKALILAGIDPYLGFLHRDDYNYKINHSHTEHIANGVSLDKTGKVLLVVEWNKYFEEQKVRYRGRNQTRANIIQFEAHSLAQRLLGRAVQELEIVEF